MRGRQTMAKVLGKPSPEDVKRVAVAALVAALDDGKEKARKNPRLTGMRAVATGAVLYTAGKAAYSGRRFISEHLNRDGEPEDEAYQEDDVDEGDDVDEEPEEDEDFEEDEEREEEPVAEEDEDYEEDEDFEGDEEREEEPVAEEDEDYEDEDEGYDEEERSAASEPPVHRDDENVDDADLPPRPSRKRTPVGRR